MKGFASGEDVTFRLEVTGAMGPPRTYSYGAVEGTEIVDGDTVVVYRADQHLRLVSNGVPTTGTADPQADYDDEYGGDQTVLVALGDTVRGVAIDGSGVEIGTEPVTVGQMGCSQAPQTICTAHVVFRELTGVASSPSVSVERATEDWAQASVRFALDGQGPDIVPVRNVLQVEGTATASGTATVRVVNVSSGATADIAVSLSVGESAESVAQKLAQAINAEAAFTALRVRHEPGFDPPVWWVMVNRGSNVNFENPSAPSGITLDSLGLNFPPLAPGQFMGPGEHHALALNFVDTDATNVDVIVVPDSSLLPNPQTPQLVVAAYSYPYLWRDRMPGTQNTSFVVPLALDGDDTTVPFTFGHELGHILLNGRYTGDIRDDHGHDHRTWNLMHYPTSRRERYEASKRLRQTQADDARGDSGPATNNPLLREN